MDIKLKYKAWIGEKHADIAHKLIGNDIETFALEFVEHLVKNCSIPIVSVMSEHHCGNKLTEKELFHDHCLKCGEHISED